MLTSGARGSQLSSSASSVILLLIVLFRQISMSEAVVWSKCNVKMWAMQDDSTFADTHRKALHFQKESKQKTGYK